MERFGVLFFLLCLSMCVTMTCIFIKKKEDDKKTLSNNVMYTTKFTTSLTNQSGTVENIFKNKDNTKVFILLKFDDISKVSTDAANYQMFLTGTSLNLTQTTLKCNPSSCIYMFGSTGYMGIYLVESRGFEPQILDLVVRCNSELVTNESSRTNTEAEIDASFSKHDQFRIYFNPGGTNAIQTEVLDTEVMNASDIYEELVSREKETKIRETLQQDLKTMQTNLTAIQDYTALLERDGLVVPEMPALIKGDVVEEDENGILRLTTDTVIAKGFHFNWQDGSIREGYLDDLCDGLSYAQFFVAKNQEVNGVPFSTSKLEWYYQDGSLFDGSIASDVNTVATINNEITWLTTAWNTYYQNKSTYQCTHLKSLLTLEMDTRNVDTNCTINASDDVLTLY